METAELECGLTSNLIQIPEETCIALPAKWHHENERIFDGESCSVLLVDQTRKSENKPKVGKSDFQQDGLVQRANLLGALKHSCFIKVTKDDQSKALQSWESPSPSSQELFTNNNHHFEKKSRQMENVNFQS